MNPDGIRSYRYEVGGSVPVDSPTYVSRKVDEELYAAVSAGELCYILNARQMGKSSLRVRTTERLRSAGIACGDIDLAIPGRKGVQAEEWFAGLVHRLASRFQLARDARLHLEGQGPISPVQRLSIFLEEVLLPRISGDIVIFFDEIDTVFDLDFGDDFFSLLRACQEQRADQPEYRRLTFVLIGVATPSELVKDRNRSPFNIGRAIQLEGFRFEEARPALIPGLEPKFEDPDAVLREILAWTGGQPFLTQKLCRLAASAPAVPSRGDEAAWVADLVRSRIVERWEEQDEPVHLRTIRNRILQSGDQRAGRLLGLYQRVLTGQETAGGDSPEEMELRLSGLVVAREGRLEVANRIYASIFDQNWTSKQLADLRPYAAALDAWISSGGKAPESLLIGDALGAAQHWAEGKRLSDEDYKFLAASAAASADLEKRQLEADLKADLADLKAEQEAANLLLKQTTKRAKRASVIFMAVAAASILLIAGAVWQALRAQEHAMAAEKRATRALDREVKVSEYIRQLQAEAESALKGRAEELQRIQKQLGSTRSELGNAQASLRQAQVRGEAAAYVSAIGQVSSGPPPAEMAVLQRLASQRSEEIRMDFLRQALQTGDSAERLLKRMDMAVLAAVGMNPHRREQVLGEILLPCLRDTRSDLRIRVACAEIGAVLKISNREVAALTLDVMGDAIPGMSDPATLDFLVKALAEVAGDLAPSRVLEAWKLSMQATKRFGFLDTYEIGDSLTRIASHLPAKHRKLAVADLMAALRDGHDVGFWLEVLTSVPGAATPEQWRAVLTPALEVRRNPLKSFPVDQVKRTTLRMFAQWSPEDRLEALDELLEVNEELSGSDFDLLESVADLFTPANADQALRKMTAALFKVDENYYPDRWIPAFKILASKTSPPTRVQVQKEAITFIEEAWSGKDRVSAQEVLAVWAQALGELPEPLTPLASRRLLDLLLTSLKQGDNFTFQQVGLGLVGIAPKLTPPEVVEPVLMGHLSEAGNEFVYIAEALGNLQGSWKPEAAKQALSILLAKDDFTGNRNQFISVIRSFGKRIDSTTAEAIAPQLLDRFERGNIKDTRIRAEVLQTWPRGVARASIEAVLWTEILAEAKKIDPESDNIMSVLEWIEAAKLLPGRFDVELEEDVLRWTNLANNFEPICPEILDLVLNRTERSRMGYSQKQVIEKLNSGQGDPVCLVGGLASLPGDLPWSEVQSIFLNFERFDFRRSWEKVAGKISHKDALTSLRFFVSIVEKQGTDQGAGRKAADALPKVAARVEPLEASQAFSALRRIVEAALAQRFGNPDANVALFGASLAALPGAIPRQDLINFLKQPYCTGPVRSAVISRLERQTGQKFDGDLWAVAVWARKQGLDVERPVLPTPEHAKL